MKLVCPDQLHLLIYIYFHQNSVLNVFLSRPSVGIILDIDAYVLRPTIFLAYTPSATIFELSNNY